MGRSAKLHKRVEKTVSSASQAIKSKPSLQAPPPPPKSPMDTPTSAPSRTHNVARVKAKANTNTNTKRRGGLKQKATGAVRNREGAGGGHVLGGADYVSLMMGGRRKARDEAGRLPQC